VFGPTGYQRDVRWPSKRRGGLALILAPFVSLILWLLEPGVAIIDAADPDNAAANIIALSSHPVWGEVVNILIPIGLITWVYGIVVLQGHIKENSNGDALSCLAAPFILIGMIGWVLFNR